MEWGEPSGRGQTRTRCSVCALRVGGRLIFWADNTYGQPGVTVDRVA